MTSGSSVAQNGADTLLPGEVVSCCPEWFRKGLAEMIGTFLLVLIGCGAVHSAVLTGSLVGLWQVAVVWGVAIMVGVYAVGATSGAHLNPAITLALAWRGKFAWRLVTPYLVGQFLGAWVAAATLYTLFSPYLLAKEAEKGIVRGQPGSELTAMCYGEYFPSPGPLAASPGKYTTQAHAGLNAKVSEPVAMLAEGLGTMILALVVFAVGDPRNMAGPGSRLAPVFVGLTVSGLIAFIAPLTQACFNPARDFGPRLFAFLAGWNAAALPGPRGMGFLTVYIVAPIVGAVAGGHLYDFVLRPSSPQTGKN